MDVSPIEKTEVKCTINEVFGSSCITQAIRNKTSQNLEVVIDFPLKKDTILHQFTAKIGDKTVVSKILEKEKAKEKYSDAVATGNLAITGGYSNDEKESYLINLGNLAPNELVELTSEFIQIIKSEDKSYMYSIALQDFPTIYTGEASNTQSSITFSAEVRCKSKITRLISPSHAVMREFSSDYLSCQLTISTEQLTNLTSNISILFRTEDINKLSLYEQFDPALGYYAYTFHFLLDQRENIKPTSSPDIEDKKKYSELYESNCLNDTPGVFIFLVDQSGSMSGTSIKIAEESIRLFLQSLPSNSYFDIIGFGSDYQAYTETPLFYNSENVSLVLTKITNLEANLGGTEIYQPLDFIFKRNYNQFYSKNVFLLTDGEVSNAVQCVDLISQYFRNFRVHAIGIGNSVDRNFIESSGKAGKGLSLFAPDVKTLSSQVIKALNCAIKPYLNNIKLELDDPSFESNLIIEYPPKGKNLLSYQDEMFIYSFVSKNQLSKEAHLTYSAFHANDNKIVTSAMKLGEVVSQLYNGSLMSKAIVGTTLRNAGEYNLSQNDQVDLSTRFQVASKCTGLFAEVKRENSTTNEVITMCLGGKKPQPKPQPEEFEVGEPVNQFCYYNAYEGEACDDEGYGAKYDLDECECEENEKKYLMNYCCDVNNEKEKEECMIQVAKSEDSSSIPIIEDYKPVIQASPQTDIYHDLISSQNMFEGTWSLNSHSQKVIEQYQTTYYPKLENYFKSININDETLNKTLMVTILVVIYLNEFYGNKKDEFLLITNKAKKFVLSMGIDFDQCVQQVTQG